MANTIPAVAAKGVVNVTAEPLHTALITLSLSRAVEQAAPGESCLPLYLYPLLPAGLPSPVPPAAPSGNVALPAPGESVSKKLSSAPTAVGSSAYIGAGRATQLYILSHTYA